MNDRPEFFSSRTIDDVPIHVRTIKSIARPMWRERAMVSEQITEQLESALANCHAKIKKLESALPAPEFLEWIADRLVNVHGDNPNIDYVNNLRGWAKTIRDTKADA